MMKCIIVFDIISIKVADNTPLARSWRESSGDSSVIAPVIVTVVQGSNGNCNNSGKSSSGSSSMKNKKV